MGRLGLVLMLMAASLSGCAARSADGEPTAPEGKGQTSDGGGAGGADAAPIDGAPPTATGERCENGLDDDGDGDVDEGCACLPGTEQPCFGGRPEQAGVGECGMGRQPCLTGSEFGGYGACEDWNAPTEEICDGLDNDCDGAVDEDLGSVQCGVGACGRDVARCVGGALSDCVPGEPLAEICDNGLDDDCDGEVDECVPCLESEESASGSPWEIHLGRGPICYGEHFDSHGQVEQYAYANIPAAADGGWAPHPDPAISFSDPSTLCGGSCPCLSGGDFTYFQTTFQIPAGYTVSSLIVSIANVDDGVRVTLYNARFPDGTTPPGSYAFLGGGSTSDLAAFTAPGSNRLVLTHLDDCCSTRQIANATVAIDGIDAIACD